MSRQMLNEKTFATESLAEAPAAVTEAKRRTMSVGGVVLKSLFLLLITVIFAGVGWRAAATILPSSGLWFFLGFMLLIGLSIAAAGNPKIAPVAGLFYAVLMGTWMGSISRMYNAYYEGIVGQALLATIAVFFVCMLLYATGIVKVNRKFISITIIALFGIMLMYLVGWLLWLFGVNLFPQGVTPVAIGISLVICIIAAMSLLVDIGFVAQGVAGGAPKEWEWYCAFSLISTLVWLYLEILRLLALLRAGS